MKILIRPSITFLLLFILGALPAYGEQGGFGVSFPALWEEILKNAPSEKAAGFLLQAATLEKERDLRLGYPRLYLDARFFSTNDPALSFFSVLNQRQIHSSDFAPDLLNDPGYQIYQKGTLGFDWPFYDGGTRSARIGSQEKVIQAKGDEQKRETIDLYAESAVLYGSALIFETEAGDLKRILDSINQLAAQYRIGVKSNPLGYSGLLGLKTLKNRINEALIDNGSGLNSALNGLREKSGRLSLDWKPVSGPKRENILPFARQFLAAAGDQRSPGFSASVRAMEAETEASEKEIEEELSKNKPRAGVFSEASLYNGNRDTASSYVLGVYLQWDLFSMDRYRKGDQARATALALKAKSDDLRLREKIEQEHALNSIAALEKQIELMSDSSKLLEEQAKTSTKLFLNGSINVLQLIEVYNQNLDLTIHRTDAEREYLSASSKRFKLSGLEIPLAQGEAGHD